MVLSWVVSDTPVWVYRFGLGISTHIGIKAQKGLWGHSFRCR